MVHDLVVLGGFSEEIGGELRYSKQYRCGLLGEEGGQDLGEVPCQSVVELPFYVAEQVIDEWGHLLFRFNWHLFFD